MTLVELTVSMFIGSVVLAALATVFVGATHTERAVIARTTTTADARVAMEAMTRGLRVTVDPPGTATAFAVAGDNTVTFYSSLTTPTATTDPAPTKIQYTYDTTRKCLARTEWPATGSFPTYSWPDATKHSTCLAFGSLTTGAPALFTYYASGDGTVAVPTIAGVVPTVNLPNIRAVGLNLSLSSANSTAAPATVLSDRVELVNLIADDGLSGANQ